MAFRGEPHGETASLESIRTILRNKGGDVWSLSPDDTVYTAIALMAEKGVGALVVLSATRLVGIVSERDYARKVILKGKSSRETLVEEIMTSPVITVEPSRNVVECMRAMTEHRIRHLPVVEGGALVGIVSIGDLVNSIISAQAETIEHLRNYVTGQYPG
jgi:CBS domain-containing protein